MDENSLSRQNLVKRSPGTSLVFGAGISVRQAGFDVEGFDDCDFNNDEKDGDCKERKDGNDTVYKCDAQCKSGDHWDNDLTGYCTKTTESGYGNEGDVYTITGCHAS